MKGLARRIVTLKKFVYSVNPFVSYRKYSENKNNNRSSMFDFFAGRIKGLAPGMKNQKTNSLVPDQQRLEPLDCYLFVDKKLSGLPLD